MSTDLYIVGYSCMAPLCFILAVYAMIYGYQQNKRKQKEKEVEHIVELEGFITAKNSQSLMVVTYSLISTSLGAWVVFSPSSYALFTGYIGLITYSVSAGFTLLIPSIFGPTIQKRTNALSLSDYVKKRYGLLAQMFISLLCVYNMFVGLCAEYTAIGDLFEIIYQGERIFIVVFVGVFTSIYTAYGGIIVSVRMDQIQTFLVIIMNLIFMIYIAVEFRLVTDKPLPDYLGPNEYGYASIAAMPIGLGASVVFSEAFWQKAWVAASPKVLKKASWLAATTVTIIVFLFGFYGLLAAWNEYPLENGNYNLALFSIFNGGRPLGIFILLACLGIVMNESSVDSYQMGLVSSFSSCFFTNCPLWVTQIFCLILNAPIIYVSLQNVGIINLFLSANLICASATIPLLLGLVKFLEPYYGQLALYFGSFGGLFFASLWSYYKFDQDLSVGLKAIFYDVYYWESFVIVLFVGGGLSLLWAAGFYLLTLFFPSLKSKNRPEAKDTDRESLNVPQETQEDGINKPRIIKETPLTKI